MTALAVDNIETFAAVAPVSDLGVGVACRGVAKDFGDGDTRLRVLHEVDVDVRTSELTLLVGPSGCGKTTLISIIAGLLEPTEGTVELFGVQQSALRGRRLVEFRAANVGFVFQQYNLLPALSAAENVAVPLLIQRWSRSRALAAAREVLGRVGLADKIHSRPSQLSGGQQQRVAIARPLVNRPEGLLLDEPLGALDLKLRKEMQIELKRIQQEVGITFIHVTHDQEEAMTMAD
ncbi:MAG TPA: ABC transporter ATP-binding protein, partial [Lacipirellulaceae bacterium]|nr:ABC transporter ATP-binding protein [Lacipirellulaceae bacterium]